MYATDQNYGEAKELLLNRFGRTDLAIHSHMNKLLNIEPVKDSSDLKGLRRLFDTCQANIRSLKSLGVNTTANGTFLCTALVRSLPDDIRLSYSKARRTDKSWDVDVLIDFIRGEVEGRETCEMLGATIQGSNKPGKVQPKSVPDTRTSFPSTSALVTEVKIGAGKSAGRTTTQVYCVFCAEDTHASTKCTKFTLKQKTDIIVDSGRCFNCLRYNHDAKHRKSRFKSCKKCHKKHNFALCDENEVNMQVEAVCNLIHVGSDYTDAPHGKTVLMQTAKVNVRSSVESEAVQQVRCLLDGGSQASFIKEDISRQLNLEVVGEHSITIGNFGNNSPKSETRRRVKVVLQNLREPQKRVEIIAVEVPFLCNAVTTVSCDNLEKLMEAKGLPLADEAEQNSPPSTSIGILIGGDFYWEVVTGKVERFGSSMVALETTFGWAIQGPIQNSSIGVQNNVITVLRVSVEEKIISQTLKSFWDLENLGIHENLDETLNDDETLCQFKDSVTFEENRYHVEFPWKSEQKKILPNNLSVATKRMKSLVRKFQTDPVFYGNYKRVVDEQLQLKIAEEAPLEPATNIGVYYMPHQAVKREGSTTTKLRVVFEASAHPKGAPSLNDCVSTGPNLNPDLLLLLLRFRSHQIAILADVEKAFLQVALKPNQRDAVRFLWVTEQNGRINEDQFQVLRMARVPFGISASPFLLAATIKTHLEKFKEAEVEAYTCLERDLYVDDLVSGSDNVAIAYRLSVKISGIMDKANMPLRKWQSNSKELRDCWRKDTTMGSKLMFQEEKETVEQKVLGLLWNSESDHFSYNLTSLLNLLEHVKETKRHVLSAVAQIFDPMGILAPFVITAKIVFQELGVLQLDWDDELPENLGNKFRNWYQQMPKIPEIKLTRCYYALQNNETISAIQLHTFCDASTQAYATVIYVRYETSNGRIGISLVTSKSRVAPLKDTNTAKKKCEASNKLAKEGKLSLPRLELMGCLLGARLSNKIQELFPSHNLQVYLWTDSSIAMHWIKGSSNSYKQFVSNRTAEIQKLRKQKDWSHCPGHENPADIATRGAKVHDLKNSELWWRGPPWLKEEPSSWPKLVPNTNIPEEAKSENRNINKLALATEVTESKGLHKLIDLKKHSSIQRVFRITAYITRFITKKENREKGPLKAEDLNEAETKWIKSVQSEDFAEEIASLRENESIGVKPKPH